MGQQEKRTNRNTVWKEIQPPCMETDMNWKHAQGARKTECHPQELPHLHSWASVEQKTPSLRKWGIGLTCRCKWLYYCIMGTFSMGSACGDSTLVCQVMFWAPRTWIPSSVMACVEAQSQRFTYILFCYTPVILSEFCFSLGVVYHRKHFFFNLWDFIFTWNVKIKLYILIKYF